MFQNNEKDERVKGVANYIYENNLYIQLKNDLLQLFIKYK